MRLTVLAAALLASSPCWAQHAGERLPACLACHGANGVPAASGAPVLGGQPSDYLLVQLLLFREKQRLVPVMNAMADGLSDDDLQSLATAMSALPPPTATVQDPGPGGALIAQYRCNSCHGADLHGAGQIPRLAGQREDYLLKSLTEYKSNARAGYDPAMNEVAQEIHAEDIPVLASTIAHQP